MIIYLYLLSFAKRFFSLLKWSLVKELPATNNRYLNAKGRLYESGTVASAAAGRSYVAHPVSSISWTKGWNVVSMEQVWGLKIVDRRFGFFGDQTNFLVQSILSLSRARLARELLVFLWSHLGSRP